MRIFLISLLFSLFFSLKARGKEKIVAQVGENIILLSDLNQTKKFLKNEFFKKHPLLSIFQKKFLLNKKNLLLDFMIVDLILEKKIKEDNIPINEEILENFTKNFSKRTRRNKHFEKISRSSFQKTYFLEKTLFEKINPSDKEISDYYFIKYKKRLFDEIKYSFKLLVFQNNETGIKQAKKALKNIKKSSFERVEKSSKQTLLEKKIGERDLHPRMKKVLQGLSPSQNSSLFHFNNQIYIVKLISKKLVLSPKKQVVKIQTQEMLRKKNWKREMKLWIEKEKNLYFIKKHIL